MSILISLVAACSASAMPAQLAPQKGLPAPVAEMRVQIARAAVACDYDKLARLALAGAPEFSYTFGQATGPARHWREAEKNGEAPLATLVKLLRLPYGMEGEAGKRTYFWPAAYKGAPSEREWRALRPLFASESEWRGAVAGYKQAGGYMGYRLGITERGDWTFFVAGD